MNSSTSPLLKMSFETTMQFMQDACLYVPHSHLFVATLAAPFDMMCPRISLVRISMRTNTIPFNTLSHIWVAHHCIHAHLRVHSTLTRVSDRRGDYDTMQSPAARIVLGQPVFGGTGCVDMLFPLVPPVPEATREVMAD